MGGAFAKLCLTGISCSNIVIFTNILQEHAMKNTKLLFESKFWNQISKLVIKNAIRMCRCRAESGFLP